MRQHPPSRIAVFLYGLRKDSRTKMKLSGSEFTLTEQLLVGIYDRVSWLQWANSKAAKDGEPPPERLTEKLFGKTKEEQTDLTTYSSPEEFEAQRCRILEGR